MNAIPKDIEHAPGESYQDVLDRDPRPVPPLLRENKPADLGTAPIKASRYTSREFFLAEAEKVFKKTWQFACHEGEIANPGDTHVFDLLDKSVLVARQADGSIRAFENFCLHRGRKLMTDSGCRNQYRCPYHGFIWNTDGSFKENPFTWDFPQIDESGFSLPEVRVENWSGLVFVNFDANARALRDMLGPMADHLEYYRIQDCYKAAHVRKIAPANWKVCVEAFVETHHALGTHPQMFPYVPLEATQYDVLTDHVTRFLSAVGVTGSLWPKDKPLDEQTRIKSMFAAGTRAGFDASLPQDPDITARTYAADVARRNLEIETGEDFSEVCDADVIDGLAYDFFPNFHLWGGFSQKICYRFRPNGLNHEETIMELMLYKIAPKGRPKPAPARVNDLGDKPWTEAGELNYLGQIIQQDQVNFAPMQEGLRALGDRDLEFARYTETRCRNLHRMIDRYIAE